MNFAKANRQLPCQTLAMVLAAASLVTAEIATQPDFADSTQVQKIFSA